MGMEEMILQKVVSGFEVSELLGHGVPKPPQVGQFWDISLSKALIVLSVVFQT